MLPYFIIHALAAGCGIAIIAGPLGSLLVWRRLAYFGDALAHAALLGVSVAVLLQFNIYLGLVGICLLIALIFCKFSKQQSIANDTLLSVISHSSLALGLIIAAITNKINVLNLLYGDILSVTVNDLILIAILICIIMGLLIKIWRPLLLIALHKDLAQVHGIKVATVEAIFMLAMSLLFAIAMKLVGVLLITALLIIPAASARNISKTPEAMACIASVLGIIAVILGVGASIVWDLPTGPAIVVVAAVEFVVLQVARKAYLTLAL